MSDISIFTDKATEPANQDLVDRLASSYALWQHIYDFVFRQYPKGVAEWNYPGKKYGWSFRIKDKKRAIVYLLPREGYFKVAFVFGPDKKPPMRLWRVMFLTSLKWNWHKPGNMLKGAGLILILRMNLC